MSYLDFTTFRRVPVNSRERADLMTNDGDLINKMIHAKLAMRNIYQLRCTSGTGELLWKFNRQVIGLDWSSATRSARLTSPDCHTRAFERQSRYVYEDFH